MKLPQKTSIVLEVERFLRRGIVNGRWQEQLPGHRLLCRELQVSSWAARAALKGLAKERLIRLRPGRPYQIAAGSLRRKLRPESWTVGCLLPLPLWRFRPFMFLWVNVLSTTIQKAGGEIRFYPSPKFYGRSCSGLAELIGQNPHACWIPMQSTPQMQLWFQEKRLPVVVAGSLFPGVSLPSIDIHYRAIGRHAAGRMLAFGHERIALIGAKHGPFGQSPGVIELEQGMREAFAHIRGRPGSGFVADYHKFQDKLDVCRTFDRLMDRRDSPTALLISNSPTFLTLLSHLVRRKWEIPRHLSLCVADSEPYYCQLVPELSHYETGAEVYAKHMYRAIQHALNHTLPPDFTIRIVPRFIAGETLAARAG